MNESNNVLSSIFSAVANKTAQNNPIVEGDYIGEDGRWYCSKCHTPKQAIVKVPWLEEEQRPFCFCKCATAERLAREEEIKKRDEFERIKRLRFDGFPESDMKKWTFEKDDKSNEKVSNIARNYVENFPEMLKRGKGILFFGDTGTGKTFYAACIANALIDKGYPCLMTDFPRLEKTISGMYEGKQKYIDELNEYPLLVIDDLARERNTSYMNEIVQDIINARYMANLPTIITTNLTSEEIKNPIDIEKKRPYSRLLEMCFPIKVEGNDRRREKLKEDYEELGDILGL